MKNMESIIRRAFFYGAFVVAIIAVIEKIANIMKYTLFKEYRNPAGSSNTRPSACSSRSRCSCTRSGCCGAQS
jgi:hypothetical protein